MPPEDDNYFGATASQVAYVYLQKATKYNGFHEDYAATVSATFCSRSGTLSRNQYCPMST